VLGFSGLSAPDGVAVDRAGTVYITEGVDDRVLAFAAGATSQSVLGFTGLLGPTGVSVDGAGTVYVADSGNRVVAMAAE
jgi:serine/threonine protein kinase, bacterial